MRNLNKYPITRGEMLSVIDAMLASEPSLPDQVRFGNIRPLVLERLRTLVENAPEEEVTIRS